MLMLHLHQMIQTQIQYTYIEDVYDSKHLLYNIVILWKGQTYVNTNVCSPSHVQSNTIFITDKYQY